MRLSHLGPVRKIGARVRPTSLLPQFYPSGIHLADIATYTAAGLPMSGTDPLVAPTLAEQPTLDPAGLSGDPKLVFDGVNDSLNSNTLGAAFQSNSFELMLDIVFRDLSTNPAILHMKPTTGYGWLWFRGLSAGRLRIDCRDTANVAVDVVDLYATGLSGSPLLLNTRYKIVIRVVANKLTYTLNDTTLVTDSPVTFGMSDTHYEELSLGARRASPNVNHAPMDLYGLSVKPL